MKTATAILCALLCCGCASHKSTVYRKVSADGSVKELTRSATRTLFDSKTRLADNAVTSRTGTNLQSVVIGALNQESAASNVVAALQRAAELVAEINKLKSPLGALDGLGDLLKKPDEKPAGLLGEQAAGQPAGQAIGQDALREALRRMMETNSITQ